MSNGNQGLGSFLPSQYGTNLSAAQQAAQRNINQMMAANQAQVAAALAPQTSTIPSNFMMMSREDLDLPPVADVVSAPSSFEEQVLNQYDMSGYNTSDWEERDFQKFQDLQRYDPDDMLAASAGNEQNVQNLLDQAIFQQQAYEEFDPALYQPSYMSAQQPSYMSAQDVIESVYGEGGFPRGPQYGNAYQINPQSNLYGMNQQQMELYYALQQNPNLFQALDPGAQSSIQQYLPSDFGQNEFYNPSNIYGSGGVGSLLG